MGVFNAAVCTIFAREVLEATLIIGQYRRVIQESSQYQDIMKQKEALRAITVSTIFASFVALIVILAIYIPLAILGKRFDDTAAIIVEGISKVVAAICILQLSVKCPKWLGYYGSSKKNSNNDDSRLVDGLSLKAIKFNVAWNIWREVAEVGVFLIPFFLQDSDMVEIPVSSIIGIVVGLAAGLGVYFASHRLEDKFWLAFFLSSVTGLLSVGLFTGGMHKFEMVDDIGSTPVVWELDAPFWDHNKLPMTIIKPFGYSSTRTVLQIICYWSWLSLLLSVHYLKYLKSIPMQSIPIPDDDKLFVEEGCAGEIKINNNKDIPSTKHTNSHHKNLDYTVLDEEKGGDEDIATSSDSKDDDP